MIAAGRRGEEGSTLVIALVFVTAIALWISALLSYADAGFRAARAFRAERDLLYAADGAMDSVVRKMQVDRRCEDIYRAPSTNGVAVKVDCQPPLKPNAHNQFLNPGRAFEIGEAPRALTADAVLAGGTEQAAITLAGFGPPAPTPPLTAATLRVSHADAGLSRLEVVVVTGPLSPPLRFTSDASPCQLCLHADLREDRIPLTALVGASLVNARVTVTATRAAGARGVESLDGVWLDVTYGSGPASQSLTLRPTAHDQFESPTSAFHLGEPSGAVATATLSSEGPAAASIVLSGYTRLTVPPGAWIEQADLRVRHAELPAGSRPASDIATIEVTVAASPREGAATGDVITVSTASGLTVAPSLHEDRVDLRALGLDEPSQFRQLTVTYRVALAEGSTGAGGVEQLDGIWIELAYAPEGVPRALPSTKPGHAVLTVGNHPDEGLRVPSGALAVRGGVRSASSVQVAGGASLTVHGDVVASGACSGDITATGTVQCGAGSAPAAPPYLPALDRLPGFDPATRALGPPRAVPSCTGGLATLDPGYYDDAGALSGLTTGGCPVVWLRPGVYYFDFAVAARRGPAGTACSPAAPCTWAVTEGSVVGGTARRWDPGAPAPSPPFPGACNPDRDGVQLIFGGVSRLDLGGTGRMELCPPASAATGDPALDQRIAILGLSETLAPPETAVLAPTAHDQFVAPANAFRIEGGGSALTADAELSSGGATAASLTLAGYGAPLLLPAEQIATARLTVSHREEADVAEVRATVTLAGGATRTFSSADPPPCALCLRTGPVVVTDTVDLGPLSAAQLREVTVRYEVVLAGGPTRAGRARLDGITIDFEHGIPPLPLRSASLAPTGHDQFESPTAALSRTDGGATASVSSDTAVTRSMSLIGLAQVAVPPGSTIEAVSVSVSHHETADDVAAVNLRLGSLPPIGLARSDTAVTQTIDLKALGVDTPEEVASLRSARYEAALAPRLARTAVARLDAVWVDLTYRLPGPANQVSLVATASGPSTGFADPDGALAIDGSRAAQATLAAPDATAAAVTLTGFNQIALPPGALVDAVTLRVAHAAPAGVALSVVVTHAHGSTRIDSSGCGSGAGLCPHATLTEDRIDLSAALDQPAKLAGLSVRYEASHTGPGPATVALDGIAIDIGYRRGPMVEALAGCATAVPYQPASPASCLFLAAGGSARLALHGTVFAPTAAVGAALAGVSNFVLARGLVARTASLAIEAVAGHQAATVIVPDDDLGPRTPYTRLFTAYTEEGGRIREVLRATVRFDPRIDPSAPAVSVVTWRVLE